MLFTNLCCIIVYENLVRIPHFPHPPRNSNFFFSATSELPLNIPIMQFPTFHYYL